MKEFIEKLIYRLDRELKPDNECFEYEDDYIYAEERHNKMLNIVKTLEKEYNNGWIPCSERLPEVEADVLVSLRSLDVYTGFRANTEGCFYVEGEGYVEFENVLAWKPMLEPYKELTT